MTQVVLLIAASSVRVNDYLWYARADDWCRVMDAVPAGATVRFRLRGYGHAELYADERVMVGRALLDVLASREGA